MWASCTLPGHFTTIYICETVLEITRCLNIERIPGLAVDIVSGVKGWLLNVDMGSIHSSDTLRDMKGTVKILNLVLHFLFFHWLFDNVRSHTN
jgi:hypothetical protein